MAFLCVAPMDDSLPETIDAMDKAMNEWTDKAARGECAWVCSDCCCSFPDGMPDECSHGDQRCTDIIRRENRRGVTPNASQLGGKAKLAKVRVKRRVGRHRR